MDGKKTTMQWLKKTVLRNMLSKWGILSIDMQTAVTEDEAEPRERKDVTDDESIPDIIDAPVTPSDTLEAGSVVQGSMI